MYKARDCRRDRIVAIKVLPEHLPARPELRTRFEREARAVSSLNHPHIKRPLAADQAIAIAATEGAQNVWSPFREDRDTVILELGVVAREEAQSRREEREPSRGES